MGALNEIDQAMPGAASTPTSARFRLDHSLEAGEDLASDLGTVIRI